MATPRRPVAKAKALRAASTSSHAEDGGGASSGANSSRTRVVVLKPCPGCRRTRGCRCYYAKDGRLVVWMRVSGDGAWCCDCHGNWQTLYSRIHPLAQFGRVLEDEDFRANEWDMLFLARVTFKLEDEEQRITAGMLTQRADTFRFLEGFLGIPFRLAPSFIMGCGGGAA